MAAADPGLIFEFVLFLFAFSNFRFYLYGKKKIPLHCTNNILKSNFHICKFKKTQFKFYRLVSKNITTRSWHSYIYQHIFCFGNALIYFFVKVLSFILMTAAMHQQVQFGRYKRYKVLRQMRNEIKTYSETL